MGLIGWLLLPSCSSPRVIDQGLPAKDSPIVRQLDTRQAFSTNRALKTQEASDGDALNIARQYLARATEMAESEPPKALGLFLEAARLAFHEALASEAPFSKSQPAILYNYGAARVAQLHLKLKLTAKRHINGPTSIFRIRVTESSVDPFRLSHVSDLVPANHLEFKDFGNLQRIQLDGLGGAMIARSREVTQGTKLMHPRAGMFLPLTSFLDFTDYASTGEVKLSFYDALTTDHVTIDGRRIPLSADLTAALALPFNHVDSGPVGLRRMLDPTELARERGLIQLESFRAQKIPLILIHGLNSSPRIWLPILNKLRADPALRDRYQPMVYSYPTGLPISVNAAVFRKALAEFHSFYREELEAQQQGPVLVGHSMGAILANYQIRNSGSILAEKLFGASHQRLPLEEPERSKLEPLLYFDAPLAFSRAVFIAAPHQGSTLAESSIGRLGNRLIDLPFERDTQDHILAVEGMNEDVRAALNQRINSISGLRPGSPVLNWVWELPLSGAVRMHSIIAQEKPGPVHQSSDGVVSYPSAHVDGAHSELMVPSEDHSSILQSDLAFEELRRILLLKR